MLCEGRAGGSGWDWDSLDERGLGVGVAVADVDDRGDPSDSDDGLGRQYLASARSTQLNA
jgi:hypothetical protein